MDISYEQVVTCPQTDILDVWWLFLRAVARVLVEFQIDVEFRLWNRQIFSARNVTLEFRITLLQPFQYCGVL